MSRLTDLFVLREYLVTSDLPPVTVEIDKEARVVTVRRASDGNPLCEVAAWMFEHYPVFVPFNEDGSLANWRDYPAAYDSPTELGDQVIHWINERFE